MPCRACHTLACCLAALLAMPSAWANDPASQQLRDQQQSLRQLQQQQRLERWQRAPSPDTEESPTPETTQDSRCWPVSGVRLAGNQRLSTTALEPTVRALVQPCMGIQAINQLLKAITQDYVQAGYPTSRPYLRHAPHDGAPLDIVIVEGFVESVELSRELPLSLRSAFPDVLGHPLYLPELEQGLDQLNRLRAYEVSADLMPGQMQGGTRVMLQSQQVASRWHLDSRFDNRGSELTGRHRVTLGLGIDSPFELNDDLRLSLNTTAIDAPGSSQGAMLYYSLPHGPWTFTLNASQLRYDAPLQQTPLHSNGDSSYQGLSAERLLWRNQRGMVSASARLDRKKLINRLGDNVIGLQSPTLTTVEAGLNLLWLDNGLWNAYLGVAQGTGWLGADTPLQRADAPRPDFRKYRANLLHLRQGPANWPWRWQSELALQYSSDVLPAIEQMLLSDDSAVRGFRLHTHAGANAAVWRNTFSQALPRSPQLRPYIGLDHGWARLATGQPSQRLMGAAAGIELNLPQSRLRLDFQRALFNSALPRSQLEPGYWVLEWALSI
ncbi:ShlB/FhaC/HecB family hemolysin secretion/activation protein [Pseudomonas sp. PSKL.D1]|uniref:ShlB/FhaC/HecB family hemolysin secretion/activation protein n=1 Tax=Pseudomonas sp. PSKL.D1 TaxID=3029060 RepID=UPI0023812E3C|nr:ShlB/FhaC/HecB family hemolysin secretion/activation protein [Pseudomonas sp. PSKL.D1]WDY57001.1 ShlB/FhaC/HecB family hemolysin secretion/activation protein [Pseudomonas sp. PSKL.D1]